MTQPAVTINDLLGDLRPDQALCAFNVETFDTLRPAMLAAAEVQAPLVVSWTVPAARYLGHELVAELVGALARRYGVRYALHLDHCESAEEIREAVQSGFTSANYLNEGAIKPEDYIPTAQNLRASLGDAVSLEFILGELGHSHDGDAASRQAPSAAEVHEFIAQCGPDVVGFECGSLHGMDHRSREIDIALVREVSSTTGVPIVLHGASGVAIDALREGIDAGLRKINIETAVRASFLTGLRNALKDEEIQRKPRKITMATDTALTGTFVELLTDLTLRKM